MTVHEFEDPAAPNKEVEEMLRALLDADVIILNNGWWNKDWPKDAITVAVICNDTFSYASADAEPLPFSEIEVLHSMMEKDPDWGVTAWCIKQRRMRPLPPIEKQMRSAGQWNIDALVNP